jgi:hypothetical protein
MSKKSSININLIKSSIFGFITTIIILLPFIALMINILILYIRALDFILLILALIFSSIPILTIHFTIMTYNNYQVNPLNAKRVRLKYGVPLSIFIFILSGFLIKLLTPIFF